MISGSGKQPKTPAPASAPRLRYSDEYPRGGGKLIRHELPGKPQGLHGYTLTRDVLVNDYCAELAINSLLGCCDKVLVCDSDSTDGTREWLDKWAAHEPRLRVINWPWPNPVGDKFFLVRWINFAREHLELSMQLHVEADECLHEDDYGAIREAAAIGWPRMFDRLNFWRDAQHLSPDGTYCGHRVARLGPQALWMPSDAPDPTGSQELVITAHATPPDPRLRIFHYGALRKNEAFIRKSEIMQTAVLNSFDHRLREAREAGVHWETLCREGLAPLKDFTGTHPAAAKVWLELRGYK
jgi:hypothetical protein